MLRFANLTTGARRQKGGGEPPANMLSGTEVQSLPKRDAQEVQHLACKAFTVRVLTAFIRHAIIKSQINTPHNLCHPPHRRHRATVTPIQQRCLFLTSKIRAEPSCNTPYA